MLQLANHRPDNYMLLADGENGVLEIIWRYINYSLAVRDKPVLYDNRLKEFRNTKVKENAWLDVSRVVEASG